MSGLVKNAARFFGADLVGIGKVHPNWVYSREYNLTNDEHYTIDIPEGCEKAVVMAIAMDYEAMRSAPNGVGGSADAHPPWRVRTTKKKRGKKG